MARVDHAPPDFRAFHQSISDELCSLKDRVRNLIQDRHWLTDGEWKESVLRSVIRRHMPSSVIMGRGFVVGCDEVSTQIDILIIDADSPVLFREGDLMIVTPDAVRGVIEVKTRLARTQYTKVLKKLGRVAAMCTGASSREVWTGLFVYEVDEEQDRAILKFLSRAQQSIGGHVNCVSQGRNWFVRYWEIREGTPLPMERPFWRSYEIHDLAPSYFVGNLMAALAGNGRHDHEYAWFPEIGGKERHKRFQIQVSSQQPVPC